MYTVVTGAAGFIGSNIVKALNERGVTKIIAVDNLTKAEKFKNLIDCEIADYIDKQDFIERIQAGHFDGEIDAIFHEGACSDTMETDGRYMMENNYRYSCILLDWCQDQDVQFLYASSGCHLRRQQRVQGRAPVRRAAQCLRLLQVPVRPGCPPALAQDPSSQIVGFRYFNVYGPRETHKGRMASVAFHNFNQFAPTARSSCSKARTATRMVARCAISFSSATWPRSISFSSTIRKSPASSISAPGARRASTTSPLLRSTAVCVEKARQKTRRRWVWRNCGHRVCSNTSPSPRR
jgi:hypothetical protein